jgi:hypothetical protein
MPYTKGTIELLTVATEICRFLQQIADRSCRKDDFIDKAVKLLPLLYLKTTLVTAPASQSDALSRFTSEVDYERVRQSVAELLGNEDSYLTAFHQDMSLSDTPVATFISEDLADLYQSLNDFICRCQTGDEAMMNDALAVFIEDFREYWGEKLLGALRALHPLYCNAVG